ncbi:putative 2-dehydro-3-deoxygalactonokinase DgoK1 [Andreprevotia sp. IGB-42]|uniref:2-dehydro-3-deoxygalactonokinase n=1 Tax=Andreprevotia sp. IGB-42 TaxID=2497473 RepID=UPI00135A0DBF|nr:2-dehydro-3-deoxygalactonokinase [Andreprevotia sp. IGB-42]KAF0814475.1 putative 2-dehydro-3-deoxygalactonokinase DgoK1 [Andreprevotia sp. IGB-42]
MNILTIDTGTTNTRVTVWRHEAAVAHAARQVGVRDTAITGNATTLQAGVRATIEAALDKAHLGMDAVDLVLASGMITSNVGLHEIPHLLAPVSRRELGAGMQQALIPEVCNKPIWFVPGVRNPVENIGLHNCEAMDMMRGEEVETIALIERLAITEPAVVILPGSHSKFVHLDASQHITGCVTTLAGELLHVITHNTILAGSLDSDFASEIDEEMLLAGARSASHIGLGRACFTVRTLDQFTIYERNARANFLLGAVLGADLLTLKNSSAIRMSPGTQFIVTGKPILREALGLLVRGDDFFSGKVTITRDDQQADLAGFGAIAVARERGLLSTTGKR